MTKEGIMVYAIIYPEDSYNGELTVDINTVHSLGEGLAQTVDAVNFVLQLPRISQELFWDMKYSNVCSKIYIFPDSISFDQLQSLHIDGLFYTQTAKRITNRYIMYSDGRNAYGLLVRRIEKVDLCSKYLRDDWEHLYKQLSLGMYSQKNIIQLEKRLKKIDYLDIKEIIALPLLRMSLALDCYDETLCKVRQFLKDESSDGFDVHCAEIHLELLKKRSENYPNYSNIVNAVITYSEPSPDFFETLKERYKEVTGTKSITYNGCPESEQHIIRLMAVREALVRNAIILELHSKTNTDNKVAYQRLRRSEKNQSDVNYTMKNSYKDYKAIKVFRDMEVISERFEIDQKRTNVILSCTDIEFISQFPLGLISLNGNKVPLLNQMAVEYKPLYPLYLNYPCLFDRIPGSIITNKCKIVFIECLDKNDRVRSESDRVKDYLKEKIQEINKNPDNNIDFIYQDQFIDGKGLEQFINKNIAAEIIYISAHGNAFKGHKRTGSFEDKYDSIHIGKNENIWIPQNINDLSSKFVIISACHTSSRGIEGDNIADTLVYDYRAPCVLSPLISVDAKKNSDYMIRLFDHIFKQLDNHETFLSISEIWRKVTLEALVYDLMHDNDYFKKLMNQKIISSDKGDRLNDILNKIRQGDKNNRFGFNNISCIKEYVSQCLNKVSLPQREKCSINDLFNSNRFFPEEYFYQLIGDADNIRVASESFFMNKV